MSCIILRTQQGSLAENVERHNARTLASVQPFSAGHAFRHHLRTPPSYQQRQEPGWIKRLSIAGDDGQGSDEKEGGWRGEKKKKEERLQDRLWMPAKVIVAAARLDKPSN